MGDGNSGQVQLSVEDVRPMLTLSPIRILWLVGPPVIIQTHDDSRSISIRPVVLAVTYKYRRLSHKGDIWEVESEIGSVELMLALGLWNSKPVRHYLNP